MVILKLKIRLLKLKLERLSGVKLVHPFIKQFDTIYTTSVSQSNSRNMFKKIVDNYGTHSLESFLVKKKKHVKVTNENKDQYTNTNKVFIYYNDKGESSRTSTKKKRRMNPSKNSSVEAKLKKPKTKTTEVSSYLYIYKYICSK